MRRFLIGILLGFMFMSLGFPVAHAAPERMVIKDRTKAAKERVSRAALKNMDLEDIEDPAAKRVIGEILNYLNLQSKNRSPR